MAIQHQWIECASFEKAIITGAVTRLRPVMMTALLASIGLIPAAISTGIGSDTQKPLAIVIIGGLISGVLTGTLFVLPVLYRIFARPRVQAIDPLPEGAY